MTDPRRPLALDARGVSRRFARGRGLSAVSFRHEGHGCLAILGPNGSGKSTLLRLIAGLLRPTTGALDVIVDGRLVPAVDRRHAIGYAAPDLQFYDDWSVAENLGFVAAARGLADRAAQVAAALARVGLSERASDRVAALSSGMRQRLRLAFATLHHPAVLLLDEPGSHLDDAGRAVTERLIAEHRATGLVVLATNDEREGRLGDACIALDGGVGDPA